MKGFIITLILALVTSTLAFETNTIASLLRQKHAQSKNGLTSNDQPILRAHGSGVSDGEENQVVGYVDQAFLSYGADQY